MWRLQQRKHSRYLIWIPWIILALIPHLLLLLIVAIPDARKTYHVALGSCSQGRQYLPVVFVPEVARVTQNKTAPMQQATARVNNKKPTAQAKKTAPTTKAPLAKGVSVTPPASKKPLAKKQERPVAQKNEKSKNAPATNQKPIPQAAQAKTPEPPPELTRASAAAQPSVAEADAVPQEALYVGREQLTVMEIERHIHTIVGDKWRPPACLAPGLSCQIKLVINALGIITETSISRSSGVKVFDIAARQACKELATIPGITTETELYITLD